MLKIYFILLIFASCSSIKTPVPEVLVAKKITSNPKTCKENKFLRNLYTCTPDNKNTHSLCKRFTLVPDTYLYMNGDSQCMAMEDKNMNSLCLEEARLKNDSILHTLIQYYPFANFDQIVRKMLQEKRSITEPGEIEKLMMDDQNKFITQKLKSLGRIPAGCGEDSKEITQVMKKYHNPGTCSETKSCAQKEICIQTQGQINGFCATVFKL